MRAVIIICMYLPTCVHVSMRRYTCFCVIRTVSWSKGFMVLCAFVRFQHCRNVCQYYHDGGLLLARIK